MMSRKWNSRVSRKMILFPFFATLTLPDVSDRRSAKCSLIRFRLYRPELNPRTGTWSHHSSILMRCAFGSIFTSSGTHAARTLVRMFFPRRSSSSVNLWTSSAGFFHRCVWSHNPGCPRRSPRLLVRVRFQS